ncbi:MAG: hypothetical protein AB8G05_11210 [Oligoflexales bacterium]
MGQIGHDRALDARNGENLSFGVQSLRNIAREIPDNDFKLLVLQSICKHYWGHSDLNSIFDDYLGELDNASLKRFIRKSYWVKKSEERQKILNKHRKRLAHFSILVPW